jgi:hypothetical protein
MHIYEVRPRKDHRGVVYDAAGNVIETHEHAGQFTDANCRFSLQLPVSFTHFRYLAVV